MKDISDEFMMQLISQAKIYCVVLLRASDNYGKPESQPIVWEHARRNFALREEGLLVVVCPISDESDLKGIGIFNADIEQTRQIMEEDPAVKAGIFTFEVHTTRSFPGDCLPN